MKKLIISAAMFAASFGAFAGSNYYDVNSGHGNGVRFWSSNNYKIHMGNATEYHFGKVKDYSIKMNMNNDAEGDRGWSWGVTGAVPVGSLSMKGEMQLRKELRIGTDAKVPYGYLDAYSLLNQDELRMTQAGNYADYASLKYNKLRIAVSAPAPGLPFSEIGVGSGIFHSSSGGKISFTSNTSQYSRHGFTLKGEDNVFRLTSYEDDSKTYLKITKNSDGTGVVAVDGTFEAEEIKVKNVGADFVFADDYSLRSLDEVEAFITENKHLPEIAPASETEQGIEVGAFTEQLLMKVEELTLYMIQLKNENAQMKAEINALK